MSESARAAAERGTVPHPAAARGPRPRQPRLLLSRVPVGVPLICFSADRLPKRAELAGGSSNQETVSGEVGEPVPVGEDEGV